jgi:transketolase
MELPTIFIFTHDAMGDGEDGPTHQAVTDLCGNGKTVFNA